MVGWSGSTLDSLQHSPNVVFLASVQVGKKQKSTRPGKCVKKKKKKKEDFSRWQAESRDPWHAVDQNNNVQGGQWLGASILDGTKASVSLSGRHGMPFT